MSSIVKNYRSDIVIAIRMELAGVGMPIPSHDFVLRFFTEYEHRHYDVGRRGGRLRHCELDETGYVLTCYLKNHGLGVGELQCLFIDLAPVSGMEDGIQRTYSLTTVDSVELVDGNGDDSTSIEAQIAIDINAVLSELGATKEAILSEWGLLRVEAEHQIENARMAVDEALAAATKADNARSSVISWKTVIDGQLQTAMGNMLDRVELTESDAFGGYNIADFIFNNGTRKQMRVRNGIVPTSMPARNVSVEGIQTDSGDVHPWEPQNAQNAFAELKRDMRDALVINLTAMPGNSFSIEEEYKQQLFRVNRVNGAILHTVSYIKQWRAVHPDGEILYAFSVGDNRAKMYARAVLFDTDSIQAICFNGPEYFILQHYTKGANDAVNTVVSKCYNFATIKNNINPEIPVEMDAEAIEESGLTPADIQMEGGIVDPEISYSESKTDDVIEENKQVYRLYFETDGEHVSIIDEDLSFYFSESQQTYDAVLTWALSHPEGFVMITCKQLDLSTMESNSKYYYYQIPASVFTEDGAEWYNIYNTTIQKIKLTPEQEGIAPQDPTYLPSGIYITNSEVVTRTEFTSTLGLRLLNKVDRVEIAQDGEIIPNAIDEGSIIVLNIQTTKILPLSQIEDGTQITRLTIDENVTPTLTGSPSVPNTYSLDSDNNHYITDNGEKMALYINRTKVNQYDSTSGEWEEEGRSWEVDFELPYLSSFILNVASFLLGGYTTNVQTTKIKKDGEVKDIVTELPTVHELTQTEINDICI